MDIKAYLRFPQFSLIPGLVGLVEGLGGGGGSADTLARYFAAAGYTIGVCWAGEPPLKAGAPPVLGGDDWIAYGAAVADEVQAMGWTLRDLRAAIQFVTMEVTASMSDLAGAQEDAKNS
jgi:hypothetical protein